MTVEKHETAIQEIIATEAPAPEIERRGRAFVTVYVALVLVAALGFVALLVVVRDRDVLTLFDRPLTRTLQSVHLAVVNWALVHDSDLGWVPLNVVSYAGVCIALFALRLRLEAVVGVGSSLLADLTGLLVKTAIRRARPSGPLVHVVAHLGGYSFPSGHVIQYTTLFGFTFWVVWAVWRSSLPRNLVLLVLFLIVALVGPSRVYLGEHWPSDVLGAYLLASLWLAGTIEILLALKPRAGAWWNRRPHRRRWTAL